MPIIAPVADRSHAVYRCYDQDGALLYVGRSVDPKRRIGKHRSVRAPWVARLDTVKEEWFEGEHAASRAGDAEAAAIKWEGPEFNRQMNSGLRDVLPAAAMIGGGWLLTPGPARRRPRGSHPNPAGQNEDVVRAVRRCVDCGRSGLHLFRLLDQGRPSKGWRCTSEAACRRRERIALDRRETGHGFDLYDERAVIVGTLTGTGYLTTPADVADYVKLFGQLAELAVFGDEARAAVGRIAEDYRRQ